MIRHHSLYPQQTTPLTFFEWASAYAANAFALVVCHDGPRRNDHLDYIVAEDPHCAFAVAVEAVPDGLTGPRVVVESDGFAVEIK